MTLVAYGCVFVILFCVLWLLFSSRDGSLSKDELLKLQKALEDEDVIRRIPSYLRNTNLVVKLSTTGEINSRFPTLFEIRNMGKCHHHSFTIKGGC